MAVMLPDESDPDPQAPNVESLAAGWQALALELRYLALRGTNGSPYDAARLQKLLLRAGEAIRAVARGAANGELGLPVQRSQRGVALRILESGCPAADELGRARGLGGA